MTMLANEYVEIRNGGYYLSGTRIGLDVVAHDFMRGCSAEAIFDKYPSVGSLATFRRKIQNLSLVFL